MFYKYTINKMFRSISTYITGVFGVLPTLILGLLAMFGNIGVGYEYTSVIAVATFPLFVVFITFKTVQVFRDEIENQTMLTIVSKPFPRKRLVTEGLLSAFTMICLLSFIGIFIPMLGYLRTQSNAGEVILKDFLVMMTTILLGSIVGALGMLLSLTMKGKAFIGMMIAIFGVGFYALWGAMTGLRVATSRNTKVNNYQVKADIKYDDGHGHTGQGFIKSDDYVTYTISATSGFIGIMTNADATKQAEEVYNDFKALGDFKVMDFVKWIDPSLHWQVLYNGAASVSNHGGSVFNVITSGADLDVDVQKAWEDKSTPGTYHVIAKMQTESAIPIYYPILLWLAIGGIVVGLSFVTIKKANIS